MTYLAKKSNKLKYCGLALMLLPIAALAKPMLAPAPYHFFVGMDAAASFAKGGSNDPMIVYDGIIRDTYTTNNNNSVRPMLGINTGIEFVPQSGSPTFDIGIAGYTNPSPYSYYGNITEQAGNDPAAMLYGYHFNVVSSRIMAEVQLNWVVGQFSPFIKGGAGLAWNRAKRYKESQSDPNYPPLPPFESKTTNNFAWEGGLGISFLFNTSEDDPADFLQDRVSLGYRYVSVGQVSFGTRGGPYPYSFNLGNMAMNDIYLSYDHFF